jgi:hypothetical protein
MPQCQRSPGCNTRLDRIAPTSGVWTCPGESYGAAGCAGGETYELLTDDFHLAAVREVIAATEAEFGRRAPATSALFFWGDHPQHVVFSEVSEIYLEREARGRPRFYWQIIHEVFHHVCTPPGLVEWTHEMLAMLWTLKYLERSGNHALALANKDDVLSQKALCPMDVMLSDKTYPPGFYGRALWVGLELEREIGWEEVKRLSGFFDAFDRPDIEARRSTLANNLAAVDAILAA